MASVTVCGFGLIFSITGFHIEEVLPFLGYLIANYFAFVAAKSKPSRTLGIFAMINIALLVAMLVFDGMLSLWCILAVGLFNSIMFSNVFTLAIRELGEHTAQGSSLLVMMILGGAVVPPLQGLLADNIGVHMAFALPIVCYVYLMWYGFKGCTIRK
jgi:FHS family L-fucose permease-like MFS transporter